MNKEIAAFNADTLLLEDQEAIAELLGTPRWQRLLEEPELYVLMSHRQWIRLLCKFRTHAVRHALVMKDRQSPWTAAVFCALVEKRTGAMEWFLEAGVSPDTPDENGLLPIFGAAVYSSNATRLLLRHGAAVMSPDGHALEWAVSSAADWGNASSQEGIINDLVETMLSRGQRLSLDAGRRIDAMLWNPEHFCDDETKARIAHRIACVRSSPDTRPAGSPMA